MQMHTEQEQLRLLSCNGHRLKSAHARAGQLHLAALSSLEAPRVAGFSRMSILFFLVINCLGAKMQSRNLLQLNCCQVSATSSKRQPHGQAIMHTYHDRHVVATRPGPSLYLPMPSDQEVRRDSLSVPPVQRSSVDFINLQP